MWETSNTPACSRTARCSAPIPAYCTGISQPAKGTSFAPASSWRANSGVRFRVSAPGTGGRLAAPSRRQEASRPAEARSSVAVPSAARGPGRGAARGAARAAGGSAARGRLRRRARGRATRAGNLDRALHPEAPVAVDRAVPRVGLAGLEVDRDGGRLSGGDVRTADVLAAGTAALDLDRVGDRALVHRQDRVLAALRADIGGGELELGLDHADRHGARSGRGGGGRGGGRGGAGRFVARALAAASAAGRGDEKQGPEGDSDEPAHT